MLETHYDPHCKLSYLRAGERGMTVLLLHGWGAFKELWWSTLHHLADEFRLIALDMPGHGGSAPGPSSMAALATHIAMFCDHQRLGPLVVVGHSMGGSVAVELALARPDLVKRLVLVDAAVDAQQMPLYIRSYLHPIYGYGLLRITLRLGQAFAPLGRQVPDLHGGGWLRPWLRRSSRLAGYDAGALWRIFRGLLAAEAGTRLAAVAVPTLVVSGQFDGLVPPAHSRRTAKLIPGARYVEIAGAVHNPMDERPAAFEAALRAFLVAAMPVRDSA